MIGADFSNDSDITVLFNGQPFHANPAALLYADQALLQHLAGSKYTLAAANHPLPQSVQAKIKADAQNGFDAASFSYSGNIMFGFSFLAASFVVFLITERSR